MKKYPSLLVHLLTFGTLVLAMTVAVNAGVATAQDTEVSAEVNTRTTLTPAQKRATINANTEARMKAQADLKIKREAAEAVRKISAALQER